jgi:hypothetical protein
MEPHEAANAQPDGVDGWVVQVPGPRSLYIGRRGVGLDDAPRIPLVEIDRVYWSRFLRMGRLVVATPQGDLALEFPMPVLRRAERAIVEARLDGIVALIEAAVAHQGEHGSEEDVPEGLSDLRG